MLDTRQSPDASEHATATVGQPYPVDTPSKDELLSRAKTLLGDSYQSLRQVAQALVKAKELHEASQAEMARAIGKSEAWVSQVLRWCRSGFTGESPFGPTT